MYPATTTSLNAKNQLVFKSYCPEHQKASVQIRGEQKSLFGDETLWAFKCNQRGGHLFLACASAINPRTPEERLAAISRLMSEKAIKVGRTQN